MKCADSTATTTAANASRRSTAAATTKRDSTSNDGSDATAALADTELMCFQTFIKVARSRNEQLFEIKNTVPEALRT